MSASGLPRTISRYEIIRLLGRGAMGSVYLARDPALDREVALKVVAGDTEGEREIRKACLSRFAAEAKTLARLRHPSIVQVYDTGEHDGEPWIAFELVKGESLEAMLEQRKKLTIRRAALFAVDIASALRHAHGLNVIHRDIKPANILVEQGTGIAKLTDFGVAQTLGAPSTEDGGVVGSAGYMAPEQIDGQIADAGSDLFSLGVVLYQMTAGSHPFLRDTMAATMSATCRGDYRPLCDILPGAPKSLDAALRR
jgi:eukaryotic-like serine/threonine-protein kinase